jgi:plastocyanin
MFDAVYREGDLMDPPARGIQTTLIPSGGSAVVEFTPRVPGMYLLVDHSIFRILKGAVGQIMVGGSGEAAAKAREFYDPILTQQAAAGGHDMKGGAPAPPPLEEPEGTANKGSSRSNSGVVTIPYDASIQSADKNHSYNPGIMTVPKGTAVTWMNKDMVGHDLVFDTVDVASGAFNPGAKWSHTFNSLGRFPYHCKPHPWMKGVLIVSDSAPPLTASGSDPEAQPSGSDSSAPSPPPAPASATVRIRNRGSVPNRITVRQGGKVTLVNNDSVQHELMFDKWTWDFAYVDPGLILKPGEKLTQSITAIGTFSYHCRRHPWIKGSLTINE